MPRDCTLDKYLDGYCVESLQALTSQEISGTEKNMKLKMIIPATIGIIVGLAGSTLVEAATSSAKVSLRAEIVSEATLNAAAGVFAEKSGAGVTANVRNGSSPATLTVAASKDSDTGTETVPVASVTAKTANTTCYFAPDVPVTQRKTSSHETVAEQGCSGSYTETFNLYLAKNWKCATGSNNVTVIYTLTAP